MELTQDLPHKNISIAVRAVAGISIYLLSFLIGHLAVYDRILPHGRCYVYLILFMLSYGISSLISRKFRKAEKSKVVDSFYPYFISFFLMLGFVPLVFYRFDPDEKLKLLILLSIFVAFTLELIFKAWESGFSFKMKAAAVPKISLKVFTIELLLFSSIAGYLLLVELNPITSPSKHLVLGGSIYLSWFISAMFGHQFISTIRGVNYWRYIWQNIKSAVLFGALIFFILFILELSSLEDELILKALIAYLIISSFVFTMYYITQKPKATDEVNLKLLRANLYPEAIPDYLIIKPDRKYKIQMQIHPATLSEKLKKVFLVKTPGVYEFLEAGIDIANLDLSSSVVLRTNDSYNIEILPDGYLCFFLNLHEINDMRRLNNYFIEVNTKLINGGVFVGRLEPTKFRYKRFQSKYPFYLAHVFYFIDFIWRRVTPKLPVVKKIYFILTKGKNRAISMAEGLGRLYYCGFEILSTADIEHFIYFIAKKTAPPLKDENPSYGPFIKMKRIGKNGKVIYVYKLRTMHPYSEYLQKYLYEKYNLKEGGKINNDFRITVWGKIFRRLWIDELPMLLNWIKRDLKIVGVRPLSPHYLSLYPADLKERRFKYKPGLVPPFYAHLPKTFEEIIQSERVYLDEYEKNPFVTDIKYFFKSWYNIIVNNARSG